MSHCKSIGCSHPAMPREDFCIFCKPASGAAVNEGEGATQESLSQRYPQYYKPVGNLREIDVYAVHQLFNVQDPSGAIQHASKKLLLSGVRTGGKSIYKDIKEARDTLTRWLQLNKVME